jgi:hypothetical protein
MSDTQERRGAADSAVTDAAKTGKTVANIAKGAATGGVHGAAAAAAAMTAKKWVIPLIAALLLPIVLLTMLPSVIFGTLLGDGTDTPNAIVDSDVLMDNLTDLNTSISSVLSEGLTDVLERIDSDFAASGCDGKEVVNPYESDIVFNANAIVSQYCAYKDTDAASISKTELISLLSGHKSMLYSFTYQDDVREVTTESSEGSGEEGSTSESSSETTYETIRVYTISYNGESYFADNIFALSDDQKTLANNYAQNLTVLLGDGVYQALSETEFTGASASYDGVVFTDGSTQVTYYNQLDERWKDLPYGTDNIGGYACGPTAMSIVVSSLTSDTVDPPHMAQWAYENGYWCSGNGSYHSLIPGAAKAWGLNVEGCTTAEPQRIVDALSSGKLVVAIMGKGHFTKSGHFIVLRGCTSEGKILVADPSSYTRSQQEWDLSIILDEAGKRAGSGGPFWIIGN